VAVEVVRGHLSDERAAQLTEFWIGRGLLTPEQAQMRLSEVVCVELDPAGAIAGVNSVFAEKVPLTGDRLFWIYRSAVLDPDSEDPLLQAAFEALDADFEDGAPGPIGLCMVVADPEAMQRRPEAVWPGTEMLFAGYTDAGSQIRIRYFDGVRIGPGVPGAPSLDACRAASYPLEDRYRLEPFGEKSNVDSGDVLDFWRREGAMPEDEARRRVPEVHLVAVDREEGVAGVSSAYLQRSEQLRMDLWHYRAFVGAAHRKSSLAVNLAVHGREVLEERYVAGRDTRAEGIVYEVENEGLKQYFNLALWLPTDFTFIGENERGAHVRVHWFPGARVPPAS
jgi:hypothetical protein